MRRLGVFSQLNTRLRVSKSAYLLAAIAFHFMNSGDAIRAVDYALQAGEQALRSQAVEEAKSYYEMALQLLETGDKRYGMVLLGLSEVALRVADEQEAIVACENVLAWLALSGSASALGLAQARYETVVVGDVGSHARAAHVLKSVEIVFAQLSMLDAVEHVQSWLAKLSPASRATQRHY